MKKCVLILTLAIIFIFTFTGFALAEEQANGIQIGTVSLQRGNITEWTLDKLNLDTWNPDERRTFDYYVPFPTPFSSPPKVVCSLTRIDATSATANAVRVGVKPTGITPEGFYIRVYTWWDNLVYGVDVSWIACN